jgi:tRNA acetyltransferase TAN1
VSYGWGRFYPAREEIRRILVALGDKSPMIRRTIAQGVAGVSSVLDSRYVIKELYKMYSHDPFVFAHTVKWVPVDCWVPSDMDSMAEGLTTLRNKINKGERWMMVIEKRRYTQCHKAEIIKHLAGLIDEKVDLRQPDKIVRLEIIGRNAGISVIRPGEIFSISMAARGREFLHSNRS